VPHANSLTCGGMSGPGEPGKASTHRLTKSWQFDMREPGFQDHDLDAFLRKSLAERSGPAPRRERRSRPTPSVFRSVNFAMWFSCS